MAFVEATQTIEEVAAVPLRGLTVAMPPERRRGRQDAVVRSADSRGDGLQAGDPAGLLVQAIGRSRRTGRLPS
jgi:hypothetical protein